MNEPNWKWYVGHNDEEYDGGPYDTRAEAVQIAKEEYEGGYIIEAYHSPLNLAGCFDAMNFIETIEDNNEELRNPDGDPLIDISVEQMKDLEATVRRAIAEWQNEHKLVFLPWVFTAIRNGEYIDAEVVDS